MNCNICNKYSIYYFYRPDIICYEQENEQWVNPELILKSIGDCYTNCDVCNICEEKYDNLINSNLDLKLKLDIWTINYPCTF